MIASEEAILNDIKDKALTNEEVLSDIDGEITLSKIIEAAQSGNSELKSVLTRAGDYIGTGVGIIINIINPETIILTGTVMKAKELFFDNIIKGAKEASIIDNFAKTTIDVSALDADLGVIGASTLVLEDLFTIS